MVNSVANKKEMAGEDKDNRAGVGKEKGNRQQGGKAREEKTGECNKTVLLKKY